MHCQGGQWRFATQTLGGASTYTLIATLFGSCELVGQNSQAWGLYLYDGTKVIGFEALQQANGSGGGMRLRVEHMNTVATDTATVAGPTQNLTPNPMTLKIVKDGTNRTYYYYSNGAFVQFLQEVASTYLTETSVGFGAIAAVGANDGVDVQLLDWSLV